MAVGREEPLADGWSQVGQSSELMSSASLYLFLKVQANLGQEGYPNNTVPDTNAEENQRGRK